MSESLPEVWLRGPVDNIPPLLQPVAHALLQAREEVYAALSGFDDRLLWEKPFGAASVAFHLQHLSGVLDRLFTYADGKQLDQGQLEDLTRETVPMIENTGTEELLKRFHDQVERSLAYLKSLDQSKLAAPRGVGRKQLPSNVAGLLFHAAEHTMRHSGQLLVTIKILTSAEYRR